MSASTDKNDYRVITGVFIIGAGFLGYGVWCDTWKGIIAGLLFWALGAAMTILYGIGKAIQDEEKKSQEKEP